MSQVDQINDAMAAAIAAQEAGDFKLAATKARTAWMLISSLPDSMFDNEQLQWKPDGVKNVMDHLQRLANQAESANVDGGTTGGIIRPVPVVYTRETRFRD